MTAPRPFAPPPARRISAAARIVLDAWLGTCRAARGLRSVLRGRIPGQLVVQYTDECNADCPQCGMRKSSAFNRSKLGMDTAWRIVDAAARAGVLSISFTGGEPLLHLDEVTSLIRYARIAGIPYPRTGTNGFLFAGAADPGFEGRISRIARELAESGVYTFWISIDTHDAALHERMRGLPGVIKGIRKALPIFHAHGIYPSANLGINRAVADAGGDATGGADALYHSFRRGFAKFYGFAMDLGFTIANACYPMSVPDGGGEGLSAVYAATSQAPLMRFTASERVQVFRALFDTIPEYRARIRIFTPRCSLHSLIREYATGVPTTYPCRGGRDFFFIDAAHGDTYPCGYRGDDNLGKFWDLEPGRRSDGKPCQACDWECFRDPSEMMGPLIALAASPSEFLRRLHGDRGFTRLWVSDWAYYRACGFFDCRKAPDYRRMAAFGRNGQVAAL